jgi:diguanylate cyclase (GGDEF)-like protein
MAVEPQHDPRRPPAGARPGTRLVPRPAAAPAEDDHGPLAVETIADALDRDLVEVHFQPVVVLPARHVVGFEALARIRLPDGRLVPPGRFIPAAERSGLVVPLGLAVLRKAVAEAARWRAGPSALATATVSVNVASPQLEREDFLDLVQGILAEHDLPGSALLLEITESVATSGSVRPMLERLAALGVRIALDDFGIGFATLDNLRRLPVQVLKLDRSFVAGVVRPGADRAIVRAVLDLADSLGLSVIAEGVETAEQADVLVRLGCANVQGYLLARPGSSPEAVAAGVASTFGPPQARDRGGADDGWDPAHDAAVLAATRLLAGGDGDDRTRSAVHALATRAARLAGLTEGAVRSVGRLSLVHDLRRLHVDGGLPAALAVAPRLHRLATVLGPEPAALAAPPSGVRRRGGRARALPSAMRPGVHAAVQGDPELHVLLHAVEAVTEAGTVDPALPPAALATGLRAVAAHYAAVPDGDDVAALLVRLALDPPDLVPLADLLDDLDRRRLGRRGMEERLRSLVGITRVLSSSRDTRELLRVALEEVRRIVGAASASLERWERDTAMLRTIVNVGALGPGESVFPEDELYALGEYEPIRHTMLNRLPYLFTVDDRHADDAAVTLLKKLHKYSSAAVPVYLEGRVWGQLWFTTEVGEPEFTVGDIELLTAVATLMGSVVVQAENLDRAARLAFEDPLTRVGNRRALDDALGALAAAGTPVALALVDVDLLKEINDSEGHGHGDQALIRLADVLSAQVGTAPGALVGRLGGDEFCVVVPHQDRPGLDRLVAAALSTLAGSGGPAVSIGTAEAVGAWQPRTLLARADEALYEAKGSRRRIR